MTPTQQAIIDANYTAHTIEQLHDMSGVKIRHIREYLRMTGRIPQVGKEYVSPVSMQHSGTFEVWEFKCWVTGER